MRTLLLFVLFSLSASAASALTFNFSVSFSTGPLAGDEVSGSFSISGADFTGIGIESFSEDGTGTGLLTAFSIFPMPYGPFDLSGAKIAPDNPTVTFNNGVFASFDGDVVAGGIFNDIFKGLGGNSVQVLPDEDTQSDGTITSVARVPLPLTGALLLSGAIGLGLVRRVPKSRASMIPLT
jgi:hypothetical protein